MRELARWILVPAILAAVPGGAESASLLTFDVVADGSRRPPGDRIDVSVLFSPGEDRITLEVRAFVKLEGAPEGEAVPVEAGDDAHRDERGHWLSRVTLDRAGMASARDARVVVPYASLKLPRGTHELGYEVRGIRRGEPDFVRATPLAPVVVSSRARTEYVHREEVAAAHAVKETRPALFLDGGKLVPRDVEIETEETITTREVQLMKVEIPGGYTRPRPANYQKALPAGEQDSTRGPVIPLEGRAWAPLSRFESKPERTVYFATNRAEVAPHAPASDRFGAEAGPRVTYGSCLVNIPVEHHRRGELEVPSYWWQRRDPAKYFLVEAMGVLPRDLFVKSLSSEDVLLFVHGYNVTFASAVLQTAQLVHDLEFPGAGVAFSWPSAGTLAGYGRDERENAASVPALVEALEQLSAPIGSGGRRRKIHVIAHSMGNRLFLQAARQYELSRGTSAPGKVFGHVALAAPDVDASTFGALVPSVIRQAATTTLYYCQSDRALLASRAVHMDKPVGLMPFFADGLDTINADRANTSFLGHGYFASAHPLLLDLRLTILLDERPDRRLPPLGHATRIWGYPHWALLAFGPPG